jgi:hypothetical protein
MPIGLFTGTSQNPTLALFSASSETSEVNYYPDPGTFLLYDGLHMTYTAETIPEPGTLCLLLVPVAVAAFRQRRRLR